LAKPAFEASNGLNAETERFRADAKANGVATVKDSHPLKQAKGAAKSGAKAAAQKGVGTTARRTRGRPKSHEEAMEFVHQWPGAAQAASEGDGGKEGKGIEEPTSASGADGPRGDANDGASSAKKTRKRKAPAASKAKQEPEKASDGAKQKPEKAKIFKPPSALKRMGEGLAADEDEPQRFFDPAVYVGESPKEDGLSEYDQQVPPRAAIDGVPLTPMHNPESRQCGINTACQTLFRVPEFRAGVLNAQKVAGHPIANALKDTFDGMARGQSNTDSLLTALTGKASYEEAVCEEMGDSFEQLDATVHDCVMAFQNSCADCLQWNINVVEKCVEGDGHESAEDEIHPFFVRLAVNCECDTDMLLQKF
jgi:hypothetical protein